MLTRIVASLAFAALVGGSLVSTADAGLFGRRVSHPYRYHAPRVEFRYQQLHPAYVAPSAPVIWHINDPSLYRDESGYGES